MARSLLIAEQVKKDMETMSAAALPCETGGILVGVKARRGIWIVGAVELAEKRSPGHYTVPKDATKPAVRYAQETIDSRVGYVGEWHSHTGDFGPSSRDRATMRAIAWFGSRLGPAAPCFVLVRNTANGWCLDGFQARFTQLRRVPLLATGPLPPR